MKNPVTNPLQSDGMQVLAALESAYRTLREAGSEITVNPVLETEPQVLPRITKVMAIIQECQRDMMLHTAVLCGMKTEIKTP